MPKIDRIKTEIAFHEKMFFGALAAMLALIGWMASNYQTSTSWLLLVALAGFLGVCIFGIDQYRRIKRLLVELEHVE
ncbi:MAG: hypothetical protein HKN53_07395 [Maribacter sp.]|nr:hypothetical protein [Maribacter sp.]